MFTKSVLVSVCLATISATPSLAAEKTTPVKHSAHRSSVVAGAQRDANKAKQVVADQTRHKIQVAIWPIYFYGCDGDDMFSCD